MNKALTLSIVFLTFLALNAKADERFIFKGDTAYVDMGNPLEKYPDILELRKQLVDFELHPGDYEVEWTLIDKNLFLTAIYSASKSKPSYSINALFHTHEGKIRADWVTQDLWVPLGKVIHWEDSIRPFYTKEILFSFIHSEAKTIKEFDYPNAGESIYAKNPDSMRKFIYSNIHWKKIPYVKDQKKPVFINFESGASGKPENINIMRSADKTACNEEVKRVISILPWTILYRHGTVYKESLAFPVLLNEENRRKYTH